MVAVRQTGFKHMLTVLNCLRGEMQPVPNYDPKMVPPDWWQRAAAIEVLNKRFRHHIVGLFVRGHSDKGSIATIFTGFLLEYRERLLWLTAGHVIGKIQAALTSSEFSTDQVAWMDTFEDQGQGPHSPAPFHYRKSVMKSWEDQGSDSGVIVIGFLDREALLTNPHIRPFRLQGAWPGEDDEAEGHYIIGYPTMLTEHTQTATSDRMMLHKFAPHLVTLPVIQLPAPDADEAAKIWRFSTGFFGEIIPFSDRPLALVEDIKGMSGAPVVSLAREADGNVRYRLVGIQAGWLPDSRKLRAEPTEKVLGLIDAWL